ncbi:hypothetical protein LV478_12270 [Komagataeibacter oboediens]|uniref:Uncharacterized protein n=1 Tax=Komagataeibacter xylinus NBRC 13693 TaxID=1234668 RepID=A0A0D6QDQ0_KOMXY|nr:MULTISPECIES: hypothetical protein [Komagataeibacter]WEQ51305.1 hypothetical protein LV478_12270 [Komagataeibacter oboediens]GAO00972.1 hypothetical protein Gxy13693_076_009 [Komagataeibacter xylinus NBRC 13693]
MKPDSEPKSPQIHEEWRPAVVLVWKDTRGQARQTPPAPVPELVEEDEAYIHDEF